MNKYPVKPILLVDDEEDFVHTAWLLLKSAGFNNIIKCSDSKQALEFAENKEYSIVVLDLIMPGFSGKEILAKVVSKYPMTSVIMVTAVSETNTVVDCIKTGALDYITKPIDEMRFLIAVQNALLQYERKCESQMLKKAILKSDIDCLEAFEDIVTQNGDMHGIFRYMEVIAPTNQPVLLMGETGVGKELFARAIHKSSGCTGKFVAVNVAGLDDTMFSDTLFGHAKGAFTGAHDHRPGLIEMAANGTLFLDEIGELGNEAQVKLLRLLQERTFYPAGSDNPKLSSARIVAATNKNLEIMQRKDIFRADLYYRLQTHQVIVPPLLERKDDLPLLTDHFIHKISKDLEKSPPSYPSELLTLLHTYHFPGNVRELESLIYDALSRHSSGVLSLDVFKTYISAKHSFERESKVLKIEPMDHPQWFGNEMVLPTFKQAEQVLIQESLSRAKGNVTIAANLLCISRQALTNRISRSKVKSYKNSSK